MAVEKKYFSQGEICQIVGLSSRQVRYWANTRLIAPRVKTKGGHARYSFEDLVAFKTAKKLIESGISIQRLRKSIAQLQRYLPKIKSPLQELTLVASGDVILALYEDILFDTVSGQEWIIHVSDLQRDVENWQKRLKRLDQYKRKRVRIGKEGVSRPAVELIHGGIKSFRR